MNEDFLLAQKALMEIMKIGTAISEKKALYVEESLKKQANGRQVEWFTIVEEPSFVDMLDVCLGIFKEHDKAEQCGAGLKIEFSETLTLYIMIVAVFQESEEQKEEVLNDR